MVEPRLRTKEGETTLSYYAAYRLDQQPDDVISVPTLATFKAVSSINWFVCCTFVSSVAFRAI